MAANNFNTSPNIEIDAQINFDALLLDIMRERFPSIKSYQDGILLQAPQESPLIAATAPPATEKNDNIYQIDLDTQVEGNIQFNLNKLGSLQPNVSTTSLERLIDDSFSFFVEDEVELEENEEPEDLEDRFVVIFDIRKSDIHNVFISGGYPVIFLEKGVASDLSRLKIIPNYKTLEVELVERGLTYDDVEIVSDNEFATFGLGQLGNDTFRAGKMFVSRAGEWSLVTRFESGYRPVLPFQRDPGDYWEGTTYSQHVYKTQTPKELLRAKYEGKMVIYDVAYATDDRNRRDTSRIYSPINTINGNQSDSGLPELNLGNVRMMIKGFWKALGSPSGTYSRVLRRYKEYNNLPAMISENVRQSVERLVLEGGIETLEANDGNTPTLNSQDIPLPVWNDFPHIKSNVDILDEQEYQEYWTSSNNGEPFEIDYMEPYEPPGSIKYYVAGETAALAQQAAASYDILVAEDTAYETASGPMNTLLDIIENGITSAQAKINSLDGNYVSPAQYRPGWQTVFEDIYHVFINQNQRSLGSHNDHRLREELPNGTLNLRTGASVFFAINKKEGSRQQWASGMARLTSLDPGKKIGNREGTNELLLLRNGPEGPAGSGTGVAWDASFNESGNNTYSTNNVKFKFDLAKGMAGIISEFDRFLLSRTSGTASDAINVLQVAKQSLIDRRAQLFALVDGDYQYSPNQAILVGQDMEDELAEINSVVNTIDLANVSTNDSDISNTTAIVDNVFNSMKRACYLKSYRMYDCARRNVKYNTSYNVRWSNRAANILKAAVPELGAAIFTYFTSDGPTSFLRANIENLYDTEINFIQNQFLQQGLPLLNIDDPLDGNLGDYLNLQFTS